VIVYVDRSEVPDVEQVDPSVLLYLIQKAEQAAGRYDRLDRYYRGEYRSLYPRAAADEVRVSVNYAKYVVDIALGYYLGEPVKYDPNPVRRRAALPEEGERSQRTPLDLTPLLRCYDVQHVGQVDLEIGRTMGIMGECLELCYASGEETPRPRSAKIDPRSGVLVCDATVEHNKLFALLWERREHTDRSQYYAVTLYTDRTVKEYRSDSLKNAVFHQVGETREHFFGAVPVIAYENNGERQGDFEQITELIDAYNQLMSSRLTDKKRFVDALLVFFGMTLREGDEAKLAAEKFLDGAPLDARVEYIQKTFDEASVQVLADTLVREMHKMTLTVDLSDEQFAGNASGQALKLKLLTMNLLVKNKMRRMELGLRERFALYNRWLAVMGEMKPVSGGDVDVVFTVSMPINEAETVELVTRLRGLVDDQTLLSQLWFVRDPAEAAENLRLQRRTSGGKEEMEHDHR
jgi:SPP1 family phage portal protein